MKRILIVSNDPLNKMNSNGRTLLDLLKKYEKESLYQFYINKALETECENYFSVSDIDALKKLFLLRNTKKEKIVSMGRSNGVQKKRMVKTLPKAIIREIVWVLTFKRQKYLKNWVTEIKPEIILFQAGDSAFMYLIALYFSKICNAKMVIFNTEDYYLKNHNYYLKHNLLYKLWKKYFDYNFLKTINNTELCIYNTNLLKSDYDKVIHCNSIVIYPASNFDSSYLHVKSNHGEKIKNISYLGNLNVSGRFDALMDICEVIKNIDVSININIYSNLSDDKLKRIRDFKNINYKGFIEYEQVEKIMGESDLIIHMESVSDYSSLNLKHAFSTKIPDSLKCGTPFFVYAPTDIATGNYLKENKCAHFVSKKEDLYPYLKKIIYDKEFRYSYIEKGQEISKINHDANVNSDIMMYTLLNIGGDSY